jgi:KDEL-tailed cysteine endopeptidase
MRTLAAIALVAGAAAAPSFSEWAAAQGKKYTREEVILRRAIFAANVAKIEAHNAEGHSWSMGVNQFADLTGEEFKARYASGYRAKEKRSVNVNNALKLTTALPASVDWEAAGAVTPVKNQGQCGSCWAFSTTGAVESITFLKTGSLPSLSEQQLVDCSGAEGNQGCNGGLMDYAFQYIIDNNGIGSEASYPYQGTDGTCKTVPSVATITSYTDVPADSDTALMTAIVTQPVSVAVEADQSSFQFYTSGVMTAACGTALDHGILAVGYGTSTSDYYKVKNSWGASWGDNGYIFLGRGSQYNGGAGQCGILMDSSYPNKA